MGSGRADHEDEEGEAGRIARIRRSIQGALTRWRRATADVRERLVAAEQGRFVLWLGPATLLGALLFVDWPVDPPLAAVAVGPILTLAALWAWARGQWAGASWGLALAAAAGCGWSAGVIQAATADAPRLAAPVTARIEGRVIAEGPAQRGRRLTLDKVALNGVEGFTVRVAFSDATAPPAEIGAIIAVTAKLRPPPPPLVPGGYDQQYDLWRRGIGAVGWATGPPEILHPAAADPGSTAWLRRWLGDAVRAAIPGPAGAVTAALAVGDRSGVDAATDAALRDAGLSHILSISGLHIALVAGLVTGFLRVAIALWPWLCLRVDPMKPAAVGSLIVVAAYCALAGWDPPVVRSFVMAAFALGAILIDRDPFTVRVWSWALAVATLIEPGAVTNPGFQMSFAATLALLAATERWSGAAARLRAAGGWPFIAAGWLAAALAASGAATLATSPVAAHHFHRVSLVGVVSNLAAGPLSGLLIMPGVVLAAPAAALGWAEGPLTLAGWGVEGLLAVARIAAAWPGANIAVAAGPPVALPLIMLGGLWLCLWRGGVRLAGLGPMALGAALWAMAPPPDLIVDPDRGVTAAMTERGFYTIGGPPSDFFVQVVSERWGRPHLGRAPTQEGADGVGCGPGACWLRRPEGLAVIAWTQRALTQAQADPAVRLAAAPRLVAAGKSDGGAQVIDRAFLATAGATTARMTRDGRALELDLDLARRGTRAWTRR